MAVTELILARLVKHIGNVNPLSSFDKWNFRADYISTSDISNDIALVSISSISMKNGPCFLNPSVGLIVCLCPP